MFGVGVGVRVARFGFGVGVRVARRASHTPAPQTKQDKRDRKGRTRLPSHSGASGRHSTVNWQREIRAEKAKYHKTGAMVSAYMHPGGRRYTVKSVDGTGESI